MTRERPEVTQLVSLEFCEIFVDIIRLLDREISVIDNSFPKATFSYLHVLNRPCSHGPVEQTGTETCLSFNDNLNPEHFGLPTTSEVYLSLRMSQYPAFYNVLSLGGSPS